jgi:hypothetical protein
MFLHVYNALLYIYCEYTAYYVCISVKNAFFRTTKSAIYVQIALYKIAYNISSIHTFFQMNVFELRLFKRQHVDRVGCRAPLSGLINMFVFNILQIPGGCIRICRRCIAPNCTHLAMGLVKVYQLLILRLTQYEATNSPTNCNSDLCIKKRK